MTWQKMTTPPSTPGKTTKGKGFNLNTVFILKLENKFKFPNSFIGLELKSIYRTDLKYDVIDGAKNKCTLA